MKFKSDNSDRRPLTDDERNEGLKWLVENGFEGVSLRTSRHSVAYWVKCTVEWEIQVNHPHNGWYVSVRCQKDIGQLRPDGYSFGECTTVQEAIEDAKQSCFTGLGSRENALIDSRREIEDEIRSFIAREHDRRIRSRHRRRIR